MCVCARARARRDSALIPKSRSHGSVAMRIDRGTISLGTQRCRRYGSQNRISAGDSQNGPTAAVLAASRPSRREPPRLEECGARTICRLLGQRGPSPSSQSRDCAPTPSGTVVWRNASNRVHPRLTDGVDASRLPPLSSGNVLWENGSNRGSSSAERRALGVPNDAAARGRRPAPKK